MLFRSVSSHDKGSYERKDVNTQKWLNEEYPQIKKEAKSENTETVAITITSSVNNYEKAWSSIVFAIRDNVTGNGTQVTANQLTTDATKGTITLNKFNTLYPNGGTLVGILLNSTAAFGAFLKQYNLEILDQIRDVILHKKGNEALILYGSNLNESNNGSTE